MFTTEGASGDAFAECPSCGSLALPAGGATLVDGKAVPATDEGPASDAATRALTDESDAFAPGAAGVFSGLTGAAVSVDAAPTEALAIPGSLFDGASAPSDEDGSYNPFATGEQSVPRAVEAPFTDPSSEPAPLGPTDESGEAPTFDPFASDDDSARANPFEGAAPPPDIAPSYEQTPTRAIDRPADLDLDLGLDDDEADPGLPADLFSDAEQPGAAPLSGAAFGGTDEGTPVPAGFTTGEPTVRGNLDDPTMPLAQPIPTDTDGYAPVPGVDEAAADANAVMLQDLEAQLRQGDQVELSPFGDNSLNDDAFADLEAAFDEAAQVPTDPRAQSLVALRQETGDDLLALALSPDYQDNPQRRAPAAPSLRRQQPARPHLSLSPEAIRLVALPLRPAEMSGPAAVAPAMTARPSGPAPAAPAADEAPAPAPRQKPAVVEGTAAAAVDDEKPRARFLSPLRAAALVVVSLVLGTVAGAVFTDKPKPEMTPRARAKAEYIAGNRFYGEGRFDDAAASYEKAVTIDNQFARAHKALAASLVKLDRHEQAAAAYRRYLEFEGDGVEAELVKKVLAAYEQGG